MPEPSPSFVTAKIVEWDRLKGYGFLLLGKQRVFLHRGDFISRHKQPAVGDAIRFVLGKDAKGRTCATQATHVNDGGRITLMHLVVVLCLLILPAIALRRQALDFRWVGGYVLLIGVVTYCAYALDKRRAREREWRLSEGRLHLLELLGGWPAAFLAQRHLRHKCSKANYQFIFWLIVLLDQFAALDSLQHWQLSHAALRQLDRISEHRR